MPELETKRYVIIHGSIITGGQGGDRATKKVGDVIELDPVERALLDPTKECLIDEKLYRAKLAGKEAARRAEEEILGKATEEEPAKSEPDADTDEELKSPPAAPKKAKAKKGGA